MSEDELQYYELQAIKAEAISRRESKLQTAALITCGLCGRMISAMGGPGNGAICKPCGDQLLRGNLRGVVEWDGDSDKR